MPLNPFRKVDNDEIKQREADKKTIDENVKRLASNASALLNSIHGVKYVKELEEQRDKIIKLAIKTVDPDPVKDAFFCRAVFAKLAVLYGILDGIEKDAKR